jgi:DNA sulfur modification protein DndD
MIFQQLSLQNFGQYKGLHDLSLQTNQTEPILLIGGHNGGGKTTILDAMQLCLYGKRSNGYRRADQRWNEYLIAWINRESDLKAETRIKLSFHHPYKGKNSVFRVEFSWSSTGKSIQERKDIFINNILDQSITATWDKFIDSILPARLSTLFFFDGEQIENLVRPETAKQFLESAITELLGIGTIEQLQRDLAVLNNNKSLQNKTQAEAKKLKEAENEYATVQKQVCHMEEHLIMLRKQEKDEQKQLEILDSEYEAKGGKLLDDLTANEALKKELEGQLEEINKHIIREESGVLPLYLVKDQLQEIKTQLQEEKDITNYIQQQQQLDQLHGKYLKVAEQYGASNKVLNALSQLAIKENERIKNKLKDKTIYLNLTASVTPVLEAILKELPKTETQHKQLKKRRSQLHNRLEQLNAQLDATPEKGALKALYVQRRDSSKILSKIELELHSKEELLEQLRTKSRKLKERVVNLLGDSAQEASQYEDNQRIVLYSLKAQQYLQEFRDQLLVKHLGKLEAYILESFQHLIKKQSLVYRLKIEASSFAITLTNRDGKVIPAEKLSAGERQLLAIAIFWGLQKASHRSIPVVIDTPMGRLDSSHRDHLVRRYFPFAAHQVILLSTDEEIVGDYYTQISKHTCNEWTISYDEKIQSTQIKEGYFQ